MLKLGFKMASPRSSSGRENGKLVRMRGDSVAGELQPTGRRPRWEGKTHTLQDRVPRGEG